MKADAERFGLILEGFDEDDDDGTGIWPEHEKAVTAFVRVSTQWVWVSPGDGTSRRVGLHYGNVEVALRNAGIEMTPDLFSDLQVLEAGALQAASEGGS